MTSPPPLEPSADPPPSDAERFLTLVESYQKPLHKLCWAYGGSSHDRDDLMQEIVARLWSAYGTYDRTRSFSTWMYRVALNVSIDFRRRQRRRGRASASLDDAGPAELAAASEEESKSRQLQELRELLEQLGDQDRAILLLCLEGHSYREIGDILGISETNVGTRLNRLKQALRKSAAESTGKS